MGGTSCDVCVVEDGEVRRTDSRQIDGRTIQLPMVDVHTVGAGGGSIGWRDAGGALRVGPRSAGAEPGPACYGHGGIEPTVTDANLLLGYLAADSRLAGGVALDLVAAGESRGQPGPHAGARPAQTAAGIVAVANQEMVRALRVVTVERGIDPRGFALLPFGGAGPMHAAAIAAELGIGTILCPRASGVLSALGLCASDRRRDTARTVMLSGDELSAERIAAEVAELIAGESDLGAQGPRSSMLRLRRPGLRAGRTRTRRSRTRPTWPSASALTCRGRAGGARAPGGALPRLGGSPAGPPAARGRARGPGSVGGGRAAWGPRPGGAGPGAGAFPPLAGRAAVASGSRAEAQR